MPTQRLLRCRLWPYVIIFWRHGTAPWPGGESIPGNISAGGWVHVHHKLISSLRCKSSKNCDILPSFVGLTIHWRRFLKDITPKKFAGVNNYCKCDCWKYKPRRGRMLCCGVGHLLLDTVSLPRQPGQLGGQVPVCGDVEGLRNVAGAGHTHTTVQFLDWCL